MFSKEEVVKASTQYFNDSFSADVFLKYALKNEDDTYLEKTPEDMHWRMAKELARIDAKKFKQPLTKEDIFYWFDRFKWIVPQGSPMYGIGNTKKYISLSNCFVVALHDSYGGICQADQEIVQICKRRGGSGLDISCLRPNGTVTSNSSHSSTGIIPFMERFSNSIREVGQANRRGALMICISVHHPEILQFCKIKQDLTKVTGANISIKLTDEFLQAVEKDTEYELRWPVTGVPKTTQKISAKKVWKEIIAAARDWAEPGLLFWDNIIRNSPADSYSSLGFETIATNPCAELPLCAYDSCRLFAINLFSFVLNPFTKHAKFDFKQLYLVTKITQRLMDNLIDLELEYIDRIITKIKNDPEPKETKQTELNLWNKVREKCLNGRRTGTGITALGDTFAALGLAYGSKESIAKAEKIYRTIKFAAYEQSVDMAEELGPFPIWNHDVEKDNAFLNRFKDETVALGDGETISGADLYKRMSKSGRRNISLLTTAPTGSVSILTQTSSGVEPIYKLSYVRRRKITHTETVKPDFVDKNGDKWQEYTIYHPKVALWKEVTGETDVKKSPWHDCCAMDIDWVNRVKLQAAIQKHVDHSISSTINLPKDISYESTAEIYETAWKAGCKGITVYREGCRDGVLISKKLEECKTITKTQAPKRPKSLPCDLFVLPNKKSQILIIVGKLNSDPYEIFAMHTNDEKIIEHDKQYGTINKITRGHYIVKTDKGEVLIKDTHKALNPEEAVITRLISASLRHGADVAFIVHQLEKVEGDWNSFAKAIARVLKSYIVDGTKVTGEECPNCKSTTNLIRESGCVSCRCGWSKCG